MEYFRGQVDLLQSFRWQLWLGILDQDWSFYKEALIDHCLNL